MHDGSTKKMWNHGRKIIDFIFKRRAIGKPVCVEFETRIQADCDRSDIGMFEIGLSSQQYGNHQQGKRVATQETESTRLISIAKKNNLFIEKSEWGKYGDRKRLPSGESIVFLNNEETTITKIRNPFAKAAIKNLHVEDVIYEHLIHNILFPDTKYTFIGISEDLNEVRIVLQQKYISDRFMASPQKEIDSFLQQGLGLHIENRYYYANDYIAITDVSADGDNVLFDGEKLYFIDPIIKFKQPAQKVLEYYHKMLR